MAGRHFKLLAGFVERQVNLTSNLLTLARSCRDALADEARNISLVAASFGYEEDAGLADLEAIEPMLPTRPTLDHYRDADVPRSERP